ncbi:hypothetical protein [Streptomyces sp. NBC_00035]|uniref:hypothetical protein n=1 Tax=Streptomyces sp. NBC_00035 TaxID=2903614 RepID=UPI00324A4F6C
MQLIEDLYLGWQPLTHTDTCPRPVWDTVELRHDEGGRIVQTGADRHTCDNDDCSHANEFSRVQLRLLCKDCGTVRTITGEGLTEVCTHTSLTGWGQKPTRVGGVWLWPGQPAIPGGEPNDYLVTRDQAAAVTTDNLYGLITKYRDADGAPRWIAGALPDRDGEHYVHSLRWRHRSTGLTDLAAAAEWIATVHAQPQRPLVVSV